jgi:hypothetical protein
MKQTIAALCLSFTLLALSGGCATKPRRDIVIEIGMTEEQVIGQLGKPLRVNRSGSASGTSDQWVYSGMDFKPLGSGNKYLYFRDGKLSSWQW